MAAILANISMVYAPQFQTMADAQSLVARLITTYLTGFGITTVVSLLVFPLTSRQLLFGDMESFISCLRSALSANMTYLNSLEDTDMFAAQRTNTAGEKSARSPEAEAFLAKIRELSGIQGRIATNLTFAKREVSLGKLGPDDLQQIVRQLRQITIHVVGLSSLSDIFDRTSEERGWDQSKSLAGTMIEDAANDGEKARIQSLNEWHELLGALKQPFGGITEDIREGLMHVLLVLQLTKPSKDLGKDQEAGVGAAPKAGSEDFAEYLNRRKEEFQRSKTVMLKEWCHVHGIQLPEDFFSDPNLPDMNIPSWMNAQDSPETRSRIRRQLMVVLYVEFLLASLATRVHDLVQHVDHLKTCGKLGKTRLIVPGIKRLRKWAYDAWQEHDIHNEEYEEGFTVNLGQAYKHQRDPEHLPPENTWERFTSIFQTIGRLTSSPKSGFGLRVAVATLSIGMLNYLRDTQSLFTRNRLFWAQIMCSIGETPSA